MPPKIIANKGHSHFMNLMKSHKYKQLFIRALNRYKLIKARRLSGKKNTQKERIQVYNDVIDGPHNLDEKLYNHIIKYNYGDKLNYDLSKFNVTRYESTDEDFELNLSDIILTTKMNDPYFRQFAIINNLDNYANNSLILIIDMPNWGGGTTRFMNTIVSMYKKTVNLLIARSFNNKVHFYINDEIKLANEYDEINSVTFLHDNEHKINKIFVNHSIQHSKEFLLTAFLLNKHISTVTHDYVHIFKEPQLYMHEMLDDNLSRAYIDVNMYDEIITQNEKNICIYSKYLKNNSNIVVSPLPDYKHSLHRIDTNNVQFVIGVIGSISNRKGSCLINKLIDYSKINTAIKIILFGRIETDTPINYPHQYRYSNIEQLNTLLITHKPNILLETSLWPETYSYTLTLMMLTQLPIFYQKKQFDNVVENRLSRYNKAYGFININAFIKNINTVIKLKQNYFYVIEPTIYFNKYWNNLFSMNTIYNTNMIGRELLTYVVYFPQFHEIKENNINFYDKCTDITNLNYLLNNTSITNHESPSLTEYGLTTILDYDLSRYNSIIQKQITLLNAYDMNGFAIYYYWFSVNTITNKNMIMDDVINKFFNDSINMLNRKVFFIWANENWTNNPAFGNIGAKIENIYDAASFKQNIDNLMCYFKHVNYLKIDNKPVFFLHHPWFLNISEINLFKQMLCDECILNNFEGVHFIINSMNNTYENHSHYNFHFNYKKTPHIYLDENKQRYFDYEKYINDIDYTNDTSNIQTLVFNFDNRARLCNPDRLSMSTICKNNTEHNMKKLIRNTINSYKKNINSSEIDKILLINSWNEWGEKMAIEPSNERHFYYLDLVKNELNKN